MLRSRSLFQNIADLVMNFSPDTLYDQTSLWKSRLRLGRVIHLRKKPKILASDVTIQVKFPHQQRKGKPSFLTFLLFIWPSLCIPQNFHIAYHIIDARYQKFHKTLVPEKKINHNIQSFISQEKQEACLTFFIIVTVKFLLVFFPC